MNENKKIKSAIAFFILSIGGGLVFFIVQKSPLSSFRNIFDSLVLESEPTLEPLGADSYGSLNKNDDLSQPKSEVDDKVISQETENSMNPAQGFPFTESQKQHFTKVTEMILRTTPQELSAVSLQSFFKSLGVAFDLPNHASNGGFMRSQRNGDGKLSVARVQMRHTRDADSQRADLEGVSFAMAGGKEALEFAFQDIEKKLLDQKFELVLSSENFRQYSSEQGYNLVALWTPFLSANDDANDSNDMDVQSDSNPKKPGYIAVTLLTEDVHL